MSFDLTALARAVDAHGRVARIVIAQARGSAPREAGTSMLVWQAGQSGTIGGGALEYRAVAAARALLETGGAQVTRQALGPALNQCCGGAVVLVTEVFDAATLPGPGPVARRVEGGAAMPLAMRQALKAARGEGTAPAIRLQEGWLIEAARPARRPLWIFGAGHVGRALVAVLAPLPDFAITWVDTGPERFPADIPADVDALPAPDPVRALALAPREAQILVLTYSHALDLALCHAALGRGQARIGLIGSATKWARFRTRLGQLGHSQAEIAKIACPIGNPELGKHPQAIAVGVAAALLSAGERDKTARQDLRA
ncbi:xanthine dehydrogenase accessory protein XdhC [Mangrovicoccus algicola]|uniref:Xanthine dehydrogenase accessory protein XdhC n=1 Tax=Mangrovicoccus algicola TaxID=2771008 RepID=A0A8J6YUY8_9RHOB|nr:xanthine dehydrogenase accessory protein XdhC [Mangrovicoccus algicola]MBE3636619.1 xanthine dehydrogenase accessory protein XdhC [Mangrovicoccus algicola]